MDFFGHLPLNILGRSCSLHSSSWQSLSLTYDLQQDASCRSQIKPERELELEIKEIINANQVRRENEEGWLNLYLDEFNNNACHWLPRLCAMYLRKALPVSPHSTSWPSYERETAIPSRAHESAQPQEDVQLLQAKTSSRQAPGLILTPKLCL